MLDTYVSYLRASKKSENTINAYTRYIQEMLDKTGKNEKEIGFADLIGYQASISNLAPNSVRLRVAAVRSYFSFLVKCGVRADNPAMELEKPKANPKPKNYMTAEDITAMVNVARTARDKAIIKFMVSTGVRINELINITLEDYRKAMDNNREILIEGKGNKQRLVYVNDGTNEAIKLYLSERNDDCPYLFSSFRRTKIDPESMSRTLKSTAKRAGIPFWNEISNHCMRAAFATIAARNGVDVDTISKAMGHSSLTTTTVYIKNSQNNINNAMAMMDF